MPHDSPSVDYQLSLFRVFVGLSCGIVYVVLNLAVLIQYRNVTDMHTQTHRHTTTAYTALA